MSEPVRVQCRSRLSMFLEFRAQHRKRGWQYDDDPKNPLDLGSRKGHRRRAVQSLLSDSGSDVGGSAAVGLTPRWMGLVEHLHEDLGQIRAKMAELSQKHADHIQVRFGAGDDDEQHIEVLTAAITKMYQGARLKVDQIGKGEKLRPEELVMRDNIQRALAQELQDLSVEFRESQESYLQALTARKERTQGKLGPSDSGATESAIMMDGGESHPAMMAQVFAEGNAEYDEVVERDRELRNVAKSIRELSDIFRDLAILVIDQGTALDRIDCNLENTQHHMEESIKHLEVVEDLSKGARLRNTILVLVALILIITVIIVIRLGVRR